MGILILIIGLILFLGVHSVRIAAPGWRESQIAAHEGPYKGLYSLVSAVGLVLLIWGFGMARGETVFLYQIPRWATHLASLLIVLGFIAVAAAYTPPGNIKATLKHPMVVGVILWAAGHLLVNGDVASVILFGAFLAWAVVDRIASEGRPVPAAGPWRNDAIAVGVGGILGVVFVLFLHGPLIGVAPYG